MKKTIIPLALSALLWLLAICLFASSGSIHPACYAYAGTFIPLAFAFIYLYAASKVQGFGVPTALNGFLVVLFLIIGEIDLIMGIAFVVLAAIAEILRKIYGYDTRKGTRLSFLPMAFTFYAYTSHWWTDTEGSLAAAVEEMPAGYADKMVPVIDNVTLWIVMMVLTIPVAILAMRLAEKVLKK
ncbi:MAG: MptD family putative ECF transporter S component [Bacteroidales bacterium]|nr:MptD family putative ECF transporter S component [Bacteroidales bacterium]